MYLDCLVDIPAPLKCWKSFVYAGVTWVTFTPDITLNGARPHSAPVPPTRDFTGTFDLVTFVPSPHTKTTCTEVYSEHVTGGCVCYHLTD